MIDELNEERVREIVREELLKREMEKVRMIMKIDAFTEKMTKERNEDVQGVEL